MQKLVSIISNYVEIDVDNFDENMSLRNEIGMDSFSMMAMLVDIEEEYQCTIPESELNKFQTLKDLNNYLINL